ncbi:hypothetical protein DTL42_17520 [Bremerella cremea]|uniref:Uncharacterized protein n=1 Tax=Bremerella cremea TaxID=1031537 RepID=A0A368KRX3_9BACT|nr:hypothetical protein DTL42_17520 [Bremerella cremea]
MCDWLSPALRLLLRSPEGATVNSQGAEAPGKAWKNKSEPWKGDRRHRFKATTALSGLVLCLALFQGLAPLAINGRPVGAF